MTNAEDTEARIRRRARDWIVSRQDWVAGSDHRRRLVAQWYEVCRCFGADSYPATGVILGLAREAWMDPGLVADRCLLIQAGPDIYVWVALCDANTPAEPTEIEALLAALEAAP